MVPAQVEEEQLKPHVKLVDIKGPKTGVEVVGIERKN